VTVEAMTSTALVAIVCNAGISVDELAHATRIPVEVLRTPTLIPYREGIRLWEAAERLTNDRTIGLRAGAACRVDRVPVIGTLFAHSSSLDDASRRVVKHLPRFIVGPSMSFETSEVGGLLTYDSPSSSRHGVDALFAAILQLARDCTDTRLGPHRVAFQSARPADAGPYERFFGLRPEWGGQHCAMEFETGVLQRPFLGASPELLRVLEPHASVLMDPSRQRPRLEAEVREAVHRCVDAGHVSSISAVASRLGRSPRTLQRELAGLGLGFRTVRDRVLLERADRWLTGSNEAIGGIGAQLGFSTRSSFERAYRRWTGHSPAETRRSARVTEDDG
jgi:AraC-like DNA-binding protein